MTPDEHQRVEQLFGAADAGRPPAAGGVLRQALTVARRICAPLGFLHGEGLVHRDLKPDNIFVLPDGPPVLVDFGLMARVDASAAGRIGSSSVWPSSRPDRAP
jgi:serine/threonine protein kinase